MKTRNFIAMAMAGFFGLAMITSCGGGKSGDQSTTDNTKVTAQPAQPAVAAQIQDLVLGLRSGLRTVPAA